MTPIGDGWTPKARPKRFSAAAGPGHANDKARAYFTPSRSTTKMSVSFGLITPAAPREP